MASRVIAIQPDPDASGVWALFYAEATDEEAAEVCRERLELSSGLLALCRFKQAAHDRLCGAELLAEAVAVQSAVGEQERFHGAAVAMCNEVAAKWKAARVSLGVRSGRYVKVVAMSRTEHLNRKTKLVQAIESAMEECLDQDTEVAQPTMPGCDDTCVARAAKRLSAEHGPHRVVSLPLRRADGGPEAVLTVEFEATEKPDAAVPRDAVQALRLTCNLVAPLLLKLRDSDRWAGAKAARSLQRLAAEAVGSEHTWAKVLSIALLGVALFLVLARGEHRVGSPFIMQAQERQLVTAPFDGYLSSVNVKPGDIIEPEVTLLAALETAEMRLKLASLLAEREQHMKEADLARREGKAAEMQIAQAEADRVAADAGLLEHQIAQAELRSPMGGVVVEGDHQRKIGGAVSRGDVLFEVAPLDRLRVELRVPESRVADLNPGQRGELATAAQPGEYVPFTVETIEPRAEVVDGQNVFRVWAVLDEAAHTDWLRPGMEGVAKVGVGRASYAWLWTRDAIDWVRMKLWI